MTLKLGVIGLSEGNGHPYSWSAIFNGYEAFAMSQCGFPVIPRYLAQQTWPSAQIQEARVEAVWTQSPQRSRHIASACRIPTVCGALADMIGRVDGVLLARDDAENHLEFAEPFLKNGLPIYIDKPIALDRQSLNGLYDCSTYAGQLFTCSALRYSRELKLTADCRSRLGEIHQITAFTPKSWAKYSPHIIEPVLGLLPKDDIPMRCRASGRDNDVGGASSLCVEWRSGISTAFHALGDGVSPISLRIHGSKGHAELVFENAFSAFRSALSDFVCGIQNGADRSPKDFNERVVALIEQGLRR